MLRMSPTRCAKFLQRKLFSGRFSIFRGRIIFALAFVASKTNQLPHGQPLC
jgi:hypothetical protein